MSEVLLLFLGALVALGVEHGGSGANRWIRKRLARRSASRVDRTLAEHGEHILVGDEPVFVAQFHSAGIRRDDVHTALRSPRSPGELAKAAVSAGFDVSPTSIVAEVESEHQALTDSPHEWNGASLALRDLDISRGGAHEAPELTLSFEASDHATWKVFKRYWMEPPRDLSEGSGDDWRRVRAAFSHGFGLNSTVETSDGRLLLTRRGARTSQQQGRMHIAVNEGMRPDDLGESGAPDPVRALLRGCHEELGLSVAPEQVTIHSLILDPVRYEWGLLCHIDLRDTPWTVRRIRAQRSLGLASDDWESDRLLDYEFSADAIRDLLAQRADWVPHGYVNLGLSAMHRFPRQAGDIAEALVTRQRSSR